jgi:hypothetical protein
MTFPPPPLDDYEETKIPKWPYVALVVLLLGGGGLALYFATKAKPVVAIGEDAGTRRGDARLIAEVDDGGVPDDAEHVVIGPYPDAGVHSTRDGGVSAATHPKTFTIEVMTRPAEANVFDHHTFRGPSGVHVTEPWGTKLELECRAPHYRGKVTVSFDGSRDSIMCTAVRLKFCVDGLKNPLEDCEQDPSRMPAPSPIP